MLSRTSHPALFFSLKNLFPHGAGVLSVLLGVIVLIGWHSRIDFLIRLHPDWPAMEYGTAWSFVLGGGGLMAANAGRNKLAGFLSGGAALLAAWALGAYLFGIAVGMAPAVALAFLTGSAGSLALSSVPGTVPGAARRFFGGLAGASMTLCGGLAALGYLIDLRPLFDRDFLGALSVHAAIGLSVLGCGIMTLAYRHAADEEGKILRSIAAVVVACQLALTLLLCGGLLRQDKERQAELATTEVRSLGVRFETILHERATAIDRMAERWAVGGGTPRALWNHDAAAYLTDMHGFETIQWVDSQGRVRWTVPEDRQEALAGFDMARDPVQRLALTQARKSTASVYSAATKLADRQQGVLLVRALRVEKRFDGYLVAAFNPDVFFSRLMERVAAQGYGVEVMHGDTRLYRLGPSPDANTEKMARSQLIGSGQDSWKIRLWPATNASSVQTSPLPWLVLAGGIALTAFTAILFLSWARGIRATLQLRLAATVFENSREGISITAPDGSILSVNRAFTEITGYSAAEVIGKNPRTLQSGRQDAAFYQTMWSAIRRQGYWSGEIWNRRKNAQIYPETLNITEVRDARGRPLHYIGMFYDITERKQWEESLIAAKENAEIASQAKSQFLSSMSHELRTPLNAVLGFAQLLEMDGTLTQEQKDCVAQIIEAGTDLLELVTEVLNLSRIEAGDLDLSMEPVACAGLVEECFASMAPLAQKNGIRLESAGLGRVVVLADRARLRQVLLNLLSNAIKFNRPAGSVRINDVRLNHSHVRLEISDTGCGIAPDLMKRLFNPFERHETSPYLATTEGAGIGLAVCKRLVEAMGGSIDVISEVNAGSSFRVTLPVVDATACAEHSPLAYDI